jgi:hypothetical protein
MMRSDSSFAELLKCLDRLRDGAVERLRTNPSSDDVAIKEEATWAIGCLRLCRRLAISPDDRAIEVIRPVQTPSAEVRLVSDNESDDPERWTELRVDGSFVRLVDGDIVILKGSR